MHIPKTISLALLSVILFIGAACAPTVAQRGNMLNDDQIQELNVGQSTRSDVLRSIGSPTTKSTFDPLVWYYIGQETEKRGILDPEVTKERIFLVAFTDEGVLQDVQEIDRERVNVPYVRDKTKTHGNEVTIMQQFMGNLGKFNPQQEK